MHWTVHRTLALGILSLALAISAKAQNVTTPGGTANSVPYFTGSNTLGNSPVIIAGGNVGIGQPSPLFTLDVTGDINVNMGQTYRYAGVPLIQANPSLFNYSIGGGGNSASTGQMNLAFGSQALTSNTTGSHNLALGSGALNINSEGSYNVAVGSQTLSYNTIGQANTAVGNQALSFNANGQFNTGLGFAVLAKATTGLANTAVGAYALFSAESADFTNAFGANALVNLVSGTDNSAFGDGSGDDTLQPGSTTTIPFTTGSYNTFLGASAMSLSDNDSNETVIGARAIGAGSNSVTLGSSNVTTTVLHGNVILSSGGQITFPDGSILTQASGVGSGTSNGVTTANGITTIGGANGGIQFASSSQGIGGAFGAGGNLTLQANSVTDSANTGGYIDLGGSARGDSMINKVVISGNTNPSQSLGTMGIVVNALNNVGLGTQASSDPLSRLEVNGNLTLTPGTGASMTFADGSIQNTAWNGTTGGGDYAELVDVDGLRTSYEPGDLIMIDRDKPGHFAKTIQAYSPFVSGVYSTKPGLTGRRNTFPRENKTAEVPMAMIGIAPAKVCTCNGPIKVGDLLVSSDIPGVAMRGDDRVRLTGAIVGKAMQPLYSGQNTIEILISLQ